MDINMVWAVIEPFVSAIAGTAAGGAIVGFICRLLQGKLLRKLSADGIADKVANRLAGKTLDIDLTAVTEKKLDKISSALNKKVEKVQEETASYKPLLVQIGKGIMHLKALSVEEKESLQTAITALDSNYIPPAPDKLVTVKLQPIATEDVTAEEAERKGRSLISFGAIKG